MWIFKKRKLSNFSYAIPQYRQKNASHEQQCKAWSAFKLYTSMSLHLRGEGVSSFSRIIKNKGWSDHPRALVRNLRCLIRGDLSNRSSKPTLLPDSPKGYLSLTFKSYTSPHPFNLKYHPAVRDEITYLIRDDFFLQKTTDEIHWKKAYKSNKFEKRIGNN